MKKPIVLQRVVETTYENDFEYPTIGISGIGKSISIHKLSRQLPQKIYHKKYRRVMRTGK